MKSELGLVCHRCNRIYRSPVISMLCGFCVAAQRRA